MKRPDGGFPAPEGGKKNCEPIDGVAPPNPLPSLGLLTGPPSTAEASNVAGAQAVEDPKHVSCTYASANTVFGLIRFVASDENATKRPLKLRTGSWLFPFADPPFAAVETSCALPEVPGSIWKLTTFDVLLSGFSTLTCTAPGMAMFAAEICKLNCVALLNVAGPPTNPGFPGLLHTTEAPLTKLLPVTVSVKPADPAAALAGEMDEMAGAPDGGGGGGGGG